MPHTAQYISLQIVILREVMLVECFYCVECSWAQCRGANLPGVNALAYFPTTNDNKKVFMTLTTDYRRSLSDGQSNLGPFWRRKRQKLCRQSSRR
jgi:hypothetical protein